MEGTLDPLVGRLFMISQITPIENRTRAMPIVIMNGVAESASVNGLYFAQYSVVVDSNIATPEAIISRFQSRQIVPNSMMPKTGVSRSPHNLAMVNGMSASHATEHHPHILKENSRSENTIIDPPTNPA